MEELQKRLNEVTEGLVQFCLKTLQGDNNWNRDQALSKIQEAHWWATKGMVEQMQQAKPGKVDTAEHKGHQ